MRHIADEHERVWLRHLAINEMLKRIGKPFLAPIPNKDLSSDKRHLWETILGLPYGGLSWHRFAGQFAGWSTTRIVDHWCKEAAHGVLLNVDIDPTKGIAVDRLSPSELILVTLEFVELDPSQSLWLTGSPDVGQELAALRVKVGCVSRKPQGMHFTRFGVAVICRGPKKHKDFNQWTVPLGHMRPESQPYMITTTSSNISGIARCFYQERENVRQHVRNQRVA